MGMINWEEGEEMTTNSVLFKKALRSVGGKKEFARKSQQYSSSIHFIDTDRARLLKEYDEKWIAVYNSEVVAHGKQYNNVVKVIRRKGLPIREVALKHLSSRKVTTLF